MSWWRLRASYSFLDMHVKKGTNSNDIGSAPTVQGSSPRRQALIQSGFDLPKSISTDVRVRYVSALPGIQVPSYWTGDATVQWAASRHIRLSAQGQNLFQPHHLQQLLRAPPALGGRQVKHIPKKVERFPRVQKAIEIRFLRQIADNIEEILINRIPVKKNFNSISWQKVIGTAAKFSLDLDMTILNQNADIIFAAKDVNNMYMWQINTKCPL